MIRRESLLTTLVATALPLLASSSLASPIMDAGARVVKIHGAGGVGRVEAYGSGIVVSPTGHVLTVLGPILDTDQPRVVLSDGETKMAKVVARDAARELAMLKIDARNLPHWEFGEGASSAGRLHGDWVEPGTTVLAWSNLFGVATGDEPLSLQRGVVAAVTTMKARQGIHRFAMPGKVYILDAVTNNPGSAGGAVVLIDGSLVGMIGKELRNTASNTWVNYALPARDLTDFVLSAISGQEGPFAGNLATLVPERVNHRNDRSVDLRGIRPLPEVLDQTPPYIDGVDTDSPAALVELQADDLILFVNDAQVRTLVDLREAMAAVDADAPVRVTLLRQEKLVTVELPARPSSSAP